MNSVEFATETNPGMELVAAGLAHDVRGALAVVKGLGALAAREVLEGEGLEALKILRELDLAVTRGANLCGDLLECGRRRAMPHVGLPHEPFDLSRLLRRCVAAHAGLFAQARCTADVSVPHQLWIESHPRSIERIVSNLLRNAACHAAGVPIKVRAHGSPHGTVVIVRDHGPGVRLELLAGLSTPFEVGSADEASFQRFGLGLWIVLNLVRSLGGWLRVASELGVGTAVTFFVPGPAAVEPRPALPSSLHDTSVAP